MARLPTSRAALSIRDLQVYYGASHALQGVDLTLETGVHAVVGRNGMGKTRSRKLTVLRRIKFQNLA